MKWRKYIKENGWEFWLVNGKKVTFQICSDGGVVLSVGKEKEDAVVDMDKE